MGRSWSSYNILSVRGPVRDVDLFRHLLVGFWWVREDGRRPVRRAWMLVHRGPLPAVPDPRHWWRQCGARSAPGDDDGVNDVGPSSPPPTSTTRTPASLALIAAKRWLERAMMSNAVNTKVFRFIKEWNRLPIELRELVIKEVMSVDGLARLRQLFDSTQESILLAQNAEHEAMGNVVAPTEVQELLRAVDYEIQGWNAELLYQGYMTKRTMEEWIRDLAPNFPRLVIELIAYPESGGGPRPFKRIYHGTLIEHLNDSNSDVVRSLWPRINNRSWLIREDQHLSPVHEDEEEWRSFGFDVTEADFDFEWGLDEPCSCSECKSTKRASLPIDTSKASIALVDLWSALGLDGFVMLDDLNLFEE